MGVKRIAGFFEIKYNGISVNGRGDFTFNPGQPKREALISSRTVDGFSEKVQAPTLKGMITDFGDLHVVDDILNMVGATVTVKSGNGKTYMLEDAWYSGDGEISFENGTVQFECTGVSAEEMG
jgi:hypothetical protein